MNIARPITFSLTSSFLKSLKADPSMVMVAGIIGDTQAVVYVRNASSGRPELVKSCTSLNGGAMPPIRTQAFLTGFPSRNSTSSICQEDLSPALDDIAALLRAGLGDGCLQGYVKDVSPELGIQLACKVIDHAGGTDTALGIWC